MGAEVAVAEVGIGVGESVLLVELWAEINGGRRSGQRRVGSQGVHRRPAVVEEQDTEATQQAAGAAGLGGSLESHQVGPRAVGAHHRWCEARGEGGVSEKPCDVGGLALQLGAGVAEGRDERGFGDCGGLRVESGGICRQRSQCGFLFA